MSSETELRAAIGSLLAQGKKPSVANLKSRLGSGFPLPALIAAVQQYKNAPEQFSAEDAPSRDLAQEHSIVNGAENTETSAGEQALLKGIHDELRQIRLLLEQTLLKQEVLTQKVKKQEVKS